MMIARQPRTLPEPLAVRWCIPRKAQLERNPHLKTKSPCELCQAAGTERVCRFFPVCLTPLRRVLRSLRLAHPSAPSERFGGQLTALHALATTATL